MYALVTITYSFMIFYYLFIFLLQLDIYYVFPYLFFGGTWGVVAGRNTISQTWMCEMIQADHSSREEGGNRCLSTLHKKVLSWWYRTVVDDMLHLLKMPIVLSHSLLYFTSASFEMICISVSWKPCWNKQQSFNVHSTEREQFASKTIMLTAAVGQMWQWPWDICCSALNITSYRTLESL